MDVLSIKNYKLIYSFFSFRLLIYSNLFRYSCEQSDNLAKYGWLKHDGRSFGSQEIVDDDFILTTDFVKQDGGFHGGDWTARIRGRPRFEEVCI